MTTAIAKESRATAMILGVEEEEEEEESSKEEDGI
jgi:hypothetical protein